VVKRQRGKICGISAARALAAEVINELQLALQASLFLARIRLVKDGLALP